MQEQGGLMVEICIKTEITVVSCFYETLWTVLCNSFQLHIGSNPQTANFGGIIFMDSVTPRYQPCPSFLAHLKVLYLLLAWNLPKEALTWILEGKHCSHRLKEKWRKENKEKGIV